MKKYNVYTATPSSILALKQCYDLWVVAPSAIERDRAERFSRIHESEVKKSDLEIAVALAERGCVVGVNFDDVNWGPEQFEKNPNYGLYCIVCWARRYFNGGDFTCRMDQTAEKM